MNFTICFKFHVNVEGKEIKMQRFWLVYVKKKWLGSPIFTYLQNSFLRKSLTELLLAGSCSNHAELKRYILNL